MKRSDFINLVKEAKNSQGILDESSALDGIALHNERRFVSRKRAIAFIRWQALCFDGTWDTEELENCAHYFKRVDLI